MPRNFVPSYRPPRRVYDAGLLADEPITKTRSAMDLSERPKRSSLSEQGRAASREPPKAQDDAAVTSREANEPPAFTNPLSDVVVNPDQTAEFSCQVGFCNSYEVIICH